MRRLKRKHGFETPSLVPLADMLTNTVGIMLFILIYAVIAASGTVIVQRFPVSKNTSKKQVLVVCYRDRILWLDPDAIRAAVIKQLGGRPATWNEYGRMNNMRTADAGFSIQCVAEFYKGGPEFKKGWALVQPQDGAGEEAQSLRAPRSAFATALKQMSPQRQFVYFLVYPDSLEAFQNARRLSDQAGFNWGWCPEDSDSWIHDLIVSPEPSEEGIVFDVQG